MAAQSVRELIPRVRRAIEGPVPVSSGALTDSQVQALAADATGDVILFMAGEWPHALVVLERDSSNLPTEWGIDPAISLPEETVIASQAALTFFFHEFKDKKIHETITNEGQTWDWDISANVLKDWVKFLIEQRDRALEALTQENPVFARYASILAVRDRVAAAMLEPWANLANDTIALGLGGGIEQSPLYGLPMP